MPDLKQLPSLFARYPEVAAVYLFGSRAEGRHVHAESDIDLAVVPAGEGARDRRLDLLADLARLGFDEVDLVFLDTEDLTLRYEAVRPNRLVYAAQGFDHGSYFSLAVRQYFDFLPYLEVQRAAYKRRVSGDSSGDRSEASE